MKQLSLFQDERDEEKGEVLSASRMTDMPRFYPQQLIEEVQKRLDKGVKVHTLVLWTKHPDSLLEDELYEYLVRLKRQGIQLFLECTITGMGGIRIGEGKGSIVIEPNVPTCDNAIISLNKVIKLLGDPRRVKLRIDPIIRIRNRISGEVFTNLKYAKYIMRETSKLGIKNYVFSFLETGIHRKVDKRFSEYEWQIQQPTLDEKKLVYEWLKNKADMFNVEIKACCVRGLEENRCIDGYLLQELHDTKKKVNLKEPRKRELCACTQSIDLGGWPPKRCYSGCKYCYANAEV